MADKDYLAVPSLTFTLEPEGEVKYRLEMSDEERKVVIFLAVSGETESFEALAEATDIDRTKLIKVLAGLSVKGIIKRIVEEKEEELSDDDSPPPLVVTDQADFETSEDQIIDFFQPVLTDQMHEETAPVFDVELLPEELEACLVSLKKKNYYDALGLDPKAERSTIKRIYYDLATQVHPDQHRQLKDEKTIGLLMDIFAILTKAYETLYHTKRRMRYDRTIPEVTGVFESEEEEALNALFGEAKPEDETGLDEESDQPPGWSFYETALEAFNMGDYHTADLNFKLAVGMEPDRPEYREGMERNRELLTKQFLDDLAREARRLEEEKKFQEAGVALQKAVELNPEDPDLHYELARIRFLKTMDRDRAEEDVSWALALDPRHVDALLLLGRIHVWKGKTELAIETFREVLQLVPGHPKAKQALEMFE